MSLKVFALFFFSWKIYVELALYSLNCLLEFTQRSHLDLVFSLWECFHLSCLNCFSFQDYPPVCAQSVMSNSETPWTTALHIPPSMGFSRQEYCSRLPFPSSGDLPDPGTKSASFACLALAGKYFTTEPPGKPQDYPH